jgi:hypothetical protein
MSDIYAALSAVMGEVSSVSKDERNAGQGFNFRGIDAVVNAVGPALRKHGVIVVPRVQDCQYGTIEIGEKRKATAHVRVIVEYIFIAQDGSTISCTTAGEAMDQGDKATAKAMSVAFRIALLQALALPTSEPDPDASSYERSPAKGNIMQDRALAAKIYQDILSAEDQPALKLIWDALKDNDSLEMTWKDDAPTFAALIGERVAEMKAAAK